MRRKIFGIIICLVFGAENRALLASTKVYFSPKGGCEAEVVNSIKGAKTQIDIAVYSLNNAAILKALDAAKARSVKIRILTDHTQAGVNSTETLGFVQKGFDFRVHSSGRIMHHKFAVFDLKRAVTGSFNWTDMAEKSNEENCLFTDEKEAVESFERRFSDHLWQKNTAEKSRKHLVKLKERVRLKTEAMRKTQELN